MGAQLGSIAGIILAPAAWLTIPTKGVRMYSDVLPRSATVGLVAGALVGAGAAQAVQVAWPTGAVDVETALRSTPEKERNSQWAILGLGVGSICATPGPGSMLFQQSPWHWRLGGGTALGAAVFAIAFVASTHPACAAMLPWLPENMQPAWARKKPTAAADGSAPAK